MRWLLALVLLAAARPAHAAPLAKAEDRPGALALYVALGPGDRAATIEAFLGALPDADELVALDQCLTRRNRGTGEPTIAAALAACRSAAP
ncbi:MAG TPA: hypothetical protein VLA00_07410 [Xanthobacteraceae bacterium]|nr:hypothetical protein [Xanthobacteraceae bacterium]